MQLNFWIISCAKSRWKHCWTKIVFGWNFFKTLENQKSFMVVKIGYPNLCKVTIETRSFIFSIFRKNYNNFQKSNKNLYLYPILTAIKLFWFSRVLKKFHPNIIFVHQCFDMDFAQEKIQKFSRKKFCQRRGTKNIQKYFPNNFQKFFLCKIHMEALMNKNYVWVRFFQNSWNSK